MHTERVLLADVETDGFLHELTRIHCISIEDLNSGEIWEFSERDGDIGEALFMLATADTIIFHNGIEFDLPAIEKIYPQWETTATIRDTLVMSRLLWSNRRDLDMKLISAGTIEGKMMGRHSLASWGQRLGENKGDFSEWCEERGIDPWGNWGWEGYTVVEGTEGTDDEYTTWCEERGIEAVTVEGTNETIIQHSVLYQMRIDYCTQDVAVLRMLANLIIDTMELRDAPEFATWLEHRFTDIMYHARGDGFYLDIPRCEALYAEISVHLEKAQKACEEAFPAKWCAVTGGMDCNTYSAKAKVLVDKQQVRIDKAAAKDKTIKTYDYKELLLPLFNILYRNEEGELNDASYPAVKISARTANVTHKFPDGSKLKYLMPAGTCYTPIHFKHFNPNSRQQIIEKLMELGWEPETYTDAGNPSTEGSILEDAAELIPIAKPIAIGLKCTKIRGYIKSPETKKDPTGWLDVVDSTGRIHPRTITIGAVTHRTAVKRPNISQIPAISMYPKGHELEKTPIKGFEGGWGWECRECFIVPPGWTLMGTDLSGIEIRLLAEEMAEYDDGEYINEVLDGDIHEKNQLAAELETRDKAKTFLYSVIYGIGDFMLGSALDPSLNKSGKKKLGKGSKTKFFKAIPAAKKVIKKYERQAKSGYITAIDGRRVPCDSGHKALNSRLQNAGAIIAKLWTIYVYDEMVELGYECGYDGDFVLGFFVHDELQIPCRTEEIANICGEIAKKQSLRVGEFFGISIPIASEYKVGKSWAETH